MKALIHEPKHAAVKYGDIKKRVVLTDTSVYLHHSGMSHAKMKTLMQRLFKVAYFLHRQCSTKYNAYKKFLHDTNPNGVTFHQYFNLHPRRCVNHKSPKSIISSLFACALQESAQKVAQLGFAVPKKMFQTCNFSFLKILTSFTFCQKQDLRQAEVCHEREMKAGTH
jgi:hypothetical protein